MYPCLWLNLVISTSTLKHPHPPLLSLKTTELVFKRDLYSYISKHEKQVYCPQKLQNYLAKIMTNNNKSSNPLDVGQTSENVLSCLVWKYLLSDKPSLMKTKLPKNLVYIENMIQMCCWCCLFCITELEHFKQ